MNPFSELARIADRGYADRAPLPDDPAAHPADPFAEDCSHTERLIRTLAAHVRLTTVELSRLTGLKTAAIWGLLKVRRASGQLVFDGTAWEINRAWLSPEVKRAVELLRSRGWTVVAPGERS